MKIIPEKLWWCESCKSECFELFGTCRACGNPCQENPSRESDGHNMTDRERWLSTDDPAWMLAALGDAADERRMLLFSESMGWTADSVRGISLRWCINYALTHTDKTEKACNIIRCLWPSPFIERIDCEDCTDGLRYDETGSMICRTCDCKGFTIINPRWRTPLVLGLAMRIAGVSMRIRMDEEPLKPQPGLMPILSDALMDAGCEVREIIEHLKADCRHMAECWVIGGLLGGATQPIESM